MLIIEDLINMDSLREKVEEQYRSSGMPFGLVDADTGEVYIKMGWQRICQDFHRKNPRSNVKCYESDTVVKDNIEGKPFFQYKCGNGLWDIGIPVYIGGLHSVTLFLGQFFYEGEHPDRQYFIDQAQTYGFDRDSYMEALDEVAVFSRDKVDKILSFYIDLARNLSLEADVSLKREKQ